MQQVMNRDSKLFRRFALLTALATVGLIVFGAVVRVTDSGLGCGDSWPLCDGTILPPLDNLTAWIEWLHRLFAAGIGVLGLATLAMAWRVYRQQRLIFGAVVTAAVLFMVQSGLGAVVVLLELPPTMVALHLGTAMLLLAALLIAYVASTYRSAARPVAGSVSIIAYLTTALSLVIILTGALVRGSGATLACVDWPLCNGDILPIQQGQLALIHMLHRLSVAALGISLIVLVWQIYQLTGGGVSKRIALAALVTYLAQAGVGALFVLTRALPVWGAAHVGLAAATWALLVTLSVVIYLDNQLAESNQNHTVWPSQSKTVPS
jgi:heme A synthase